MGENRCIEGDEGWLMVVLALTSLFSSYLVARAAKYADAMCLVEFHNFREFSAVCSQLALRMSRSTRFGVHGSYHGCFVQSEAAHPITMALSFKGDIVTGRGNDDNGPFSLDGTIHQGQLLAKIRYVNRPMTYIFLHWVEDTKEEWLPG